MLTTTKVIKKHEHPLRLIDLNPEYPRDEEVYDDEEDLIMKQAFRCPCGHCRQEINFLYRYYYKCDQCNFSSHKLCAELPTEVTHEAHREHALLLHQVDWWPSWWLCQICNIRHKYANLFYSCSICQQPQVRIGIECAKIAVQNHLIYHPSHQHPLMPISKSILAKCDACGKKHKGNFCQCTTCLRFSAHSDCVFTSKRVIIEHHTEGYLEHTHPLTLAYSFLEVDQKAKYYPKCKVCERDFRGDEHHWIFKCEKCRYYVHLRCATIGKDARMSIILKKGKNYNDVDHPRLLHLPFPDHSNNMPKHFFFQKSQSRAFETNLTHFAHRHPLVLVDTPCNNDITSPSSSRTTTIFCHDPMKKVEVLCNGCIRPIMDMQFYKCTVDLECNFFLHAWCTRLPVEIKDNIDHPQHTLTLLPKAPRFLFDVFECSVCHLACNGFAYSCVKCDYYIDVNCAFIPEKITHKSHPNHLLSRVKTQELHQSCGLCLTKIDGIEETTFTCKICTFHLHPECALLLPETITHRYDKHPMTLSYSPVENHIGDYFCEACEEEFNPYGSFYHCHQCLQSMHLSCAPLILKGRPHNSLYFRKGVYLFANIKFGDMYKIEGHPHPLSFRQGIESDGECIRCGMHLQDRVIVKCLQCKFAIDSGCATLYDPSPKPIV